MSSSDAEPKRPLGDTGESRKAVLSARKAVLDLLQVQPDVALMDHQAAENPLAVGRVRPKVPT